jgi:hypothetical protein
MPLCRFANPTALNAASGWLFVNDPENVQYLCATNVRNYGRRYLPDIYKWVTHEKGILGSQARVCEPSKFDHFAVSIGALPRSQLPDSAPGSVLFYEAHL